MMDPDVAAKQTKAAVAIFQTISCVRASKQRP